MDIEIKTFNLQEVFRFTDISDVNSTYRKLCDSGDLQNFCAWTKDTGITQKSPFFNRLIIKIEEEAGVSSWSNLYQKVKLTAYSFLSNNASAFESQLFKNEFKHFYDITNEQLICNIDLIGEYVKSGFLDIQVLQNRLDKIRPNVFDPDSHWKTMVEGFGQIILKTALKEDRIELIDQFFECISKNKFLLNPPLNLFKILLNNNIDVFRQYFKTILPWDDWRRDNSSLYEWMKNQNEIKNNPKLMLELITSSNYLEDVVSTYSYSSSSEKKLPLQTFIEFLKDCLADSQLRNHTLDIFFRCKSQYQSNSVLQKVVGDRIHILTDYLQEIQDIIRTNPDICSKMFTHLIQFQFRISKEFIFEQLLNFPYNEIMGEEKRRNLIKEDYNYEQFKRLIQYWVFQCSNGTWIHRMNITPEGRLAREFLSKNNEAGYCFILGNWLGHSHTQEYQSIIAALVGIEVETLKEIYRIQAKETYTHEEIESYHKYCSQNLTIRKHLFFYFNRELQSFLSPTDAEMFKSISRLMAALNPNDQALVGIIPTKLMKKEDPACQASLRYNREQFGNARIFAQIVLICDAYLEIEELTPGDKETLRNAKRFFKICSQLPLELQMKIANFCHGILKDNITAKEFDSALFQLMHEFALDG